MRIAELSSSLQLSQECLISSSAFIAPLMYMTEIFAMHIKQKDEYPVSKKNDAVKWLRTGFGTFFSHHSLKLVQSLMIAY